MIRLLAKLFIKDKNNFKDQMVREKYGVLTGIVGIILNVILFLIKLIAGILCASVSIMADAFNNLSDAGSSFISMISFKLANKPVDADHPFGHGRIEYVASFIVSMLVLFVGYELISSSISKIITPVKIKASFVIILILCVSILTKLYMFLYNYSYSKKIKSPVLKATAFDSISDTIATTVVLIGITVGSFTNLLLDGYIGVLVAIFILFTGIKSIKETIDVLLGQKPDKEFVCEIENFILSYDENVTGLHDLIVHNYGVGRSIISLHCEVPADKDVNMLHEIIDHLEIDLEEKFKCKAVIHMDPIILNDERINECKNLIEGMLLEIDKELKFHDFRMTDSANLTNLIFDIVVPTHKKMNFEDIEKKIKEKIKSVSPNYKVVIKCEYSYV